MKITVVGGANQIAVQLVPMLLASGHDLTVVSRRPRPSLIAAHPRLDWGGDPAASEAVIGMAPADVVAAQIARCHNPRRIIQFSSMSVLTKRDSSHAADRRLAEELRQGEQAITAQARSRGATCAILRPTLIYGHGMDQNLTRVAGFIQRWGRFPLCGDALGLRSPVHAADLSDLAAAALLRGEGVFAVGGGETLPYREMIARVFRSLDRSPRFLPVATALPALGRRLSAWPGLRRLAAPAAILERMNQDLSADNVSAAAVFGWEPRGFNPDRSTWIPLANRKGAESMVEKAQ